jgi:ribonuclease HII
LVAGLDEVGVGSLAGPLLIAVVAFPADLEPLEGINDSKKLTKASQRRLFPGIMRKASFIGLGWAHPLQIDRLGMARCWQLAAAEAMKHAPEFSHLYVDGLREVDGYEGSQSAEVKGDARFWQVGAASIIAKVTRDKDMKGD